MDWIRYPFKFTQLTKIKESFRKHMISKHGSTEAFQVVEKAFMTINELRDSLNFEILDVNNLIACENLEKVIYKYLKYTQQLQKKFKFESWHSDRVNIEFVWTDSFKQKEVVKTSNLRVEMCAVLYNLSILLYYIGNLYLARNSIEDRKSALKKFRYALWSISDLKRNLPQIIREFKKTHLDFTVQNVLMLENIVFGQSYVCLFFNMQSAEQQIGIHNVAQLSGEANKHFQQALKITTDVFNDQNSSFPNITALKMAQFHEKLLESDRTKPHLGIGIAYLQKAKEILSLALKNMENISPTMQEEIRKLTISINSTYQEYQERNSSIYKHQIPNDRSLPSTQLKEEVRVTFSIPPDLIKETDDEISFKTFLSSDMVALVKEVKKLAEQNKVEIANSVKYLKDSRNKIYMEHFVNGYLEMMYEYIFASEQSRQKQMEQQAGMMLPAASLSSQNRRFPKTIEQKMNSIFGKGGIKEIERIISLLDENSISAQILINEIIHRIEDDEREDEQNRAIHGSDWQLIPSSEANHSYLMRIKELQENLRDGESIDSLTKKRYEELGIFFNLLRAGADQILTIIPFSEKHTFADEYIGQISNIFQLDERVRKMIEVCERNLETVVQFIDMEGAIKESSARKLNRQQMINFILGPSISICEKIQFDVIKKFIRKTSKIFLVEKQVATSSSIIEEIASIAIFLNSKKLNSDAQFSIKEIEKINNGFGQIMELQNELEQGVEFYKVLFSAITDLDSEISDYLTSRILQKELQEYRIKEGQSKNKQQIDQNEEYVTDQPFFEDGHFPQGKSRYIPKPEQQEEEQNFSMQASQINLAWNNNEQSQHQVDNKESNQLQLSKGQGIFQ